MTPSKFYSDAARHLQDAFDTRRLADRFEQTIVRSAATDEDRAFLESRDFFLLATVDLDGWPQCSYKGGAPGLVRLLDARTLAFPSYDGNGMYLSMGNAAASGRLAMLFIDFEEPKRLRLQGSSSIDPDDPLRSEWPGADLVVRVAIERIWPNCPRYIHRYQRVHASPYVPGRAGDAPVPAWKTFEFVRDVLPARDVAAVEAALAKPDSERES
jgi:predicted pyridoxine 5'-phosphate oxidase superfamily flavin-nucleotide-binding protein